MVRKSSPLAPCSLLLLLAVAALPRANWAEEQLPRATPGVLAAGQNGTIPAPAGPARLLPAWSLAQQGLPASDALERLATESDPAVRYWVTVGLTNAALEAGTHDVRHTNLVARLYVMSDDQAPAVALGALEGLVRLEQYDLALPLLGRWLNDDRELVRYRAIAILDRPFPAEKLPVDAIRRVLAAGGEYPTRVASRLLARTGEK